MIETKYGTIRFERHYSKKHNKPVGVTAYFFQGMDAKNVAKNWRKNEEKAMNLAFSATTRCCSSDRFVWREGNKKAIAKVLHLTPLTKKDRGEMWGEIATQMRLTGKSK